MTKYNYFIRNERVCDVLGNRNHILVFDIKQGVLRKYSCKNENELDLILKNYSNYKFFENVAVNNAYSAPCKIFLDITSNCNMNCPHCLNRKTSRDSYFMSEIEIEKIVKYCESKGVFFVKIGGGEPLLHPNIIKIMNCFYKIGMLVSLTTNGTIHAPEIINAIDNNNIKISVSLDGDPETHDKIRGKGAYLSAIKFIDLLINRNIFPTIKYIISDYNKHDESIFHVINLGEQKNLMVNIKFMKPINGCMASFNGITALDVKNIMNKCKLENNVILDETWFSDVKPLDTEFMFANKVCNAGSTSMHIGYYGEVRPCIFIDDKYFDMIPRIEEKDIDEIWKTDSNFQMVRQLSITKQCQNCSNTCKYVCYAYRNYYSNDLLGDNLICKQCW